MNFVDKDGATKMYIPVHPWCWQASLCTVLSIRVRKGFGYRVSLLFFQVLMVSIWFILGIEYQTENDFWVLKYQFQFWYQKSQKILVSGIMKLGRKFPPIPLNFQNIVWRLYASFW